MEAVFLSVKAWVYLETKQHKKLLICPGCICRQSANLMSLYSGSLYTGAYFCEEKHFNLKAVKRITFFPFSYAKPIFWYISSCARCEICSKLTITAPKYVKLTIKLTIKTPLTLFSSLLTLNTFHFLLQRFFDWLWLVNCQLGLLLDYCFNSNNLNHPKHAKRNFERSELNLQCVMHSIFVFNKMQHHPLWN